MGRPGRDGGFTMVELLVVVVILGILAAIAIPAYLDQRNAAIRAAAVSNLRAAEIAARAELAENAVFPWTNAAVLAFVRDAVPELTWRAGGNIDEQDTITIRRRSTPGARSITFMAFAGGDCRYLRVYEDGKVERHLEPINATTGRCDTGAYGRTETPSGW